MAGFYGGWLWQMHWLTRDPAWAAAATARLPGLAPIQDYTGSHDISFIIMSSFGEALKTAPPQSAQAAAHRGVLLALAALLARRYVPSLGYFRSWKAIDREPMEIIVGRRRRGPAACLPAEAQVEPGHRLPACSPATVRPSSPPHAPLPPCCRQRDEPGADVEGQPAAGQQQQVA